MTDDNAWNPRIVTPDGEPVEITDATTPRHQRESVLRDLADRGLSHLEIAAELDVSATTVQRHLSRHGISTDGNRHDQSYSHTTTLHAAGNVLTQTTPEPQTDGGSDPNSPPFECVECGRSYDVMAAQHDCLRRHARERANQLATDAKQGFEVLSV